MLRPNVNIAKINPIYQHIGDLPSTGNSNAYSTRIHVNTFTIEESNEGVSIEFDTIHDRYSINIGDKLIVSTNYYGIRESNTVLPIMVVTDVSISSDFVVNVVCIDEFSYYSQISDFIPFSPTKDQVQFLNSKMGVDLGTLNISSNSLVKDNVTVNEIFDYIYSIIKPQMFNDTLVMKVDEAVKTNKLQPPTPQLNSKVSDFIKVLSDNYYLYLYMSSISLPDISIDNNDNLCRVNHKIIVDVLGLTPLYYYVDGEPVLNYNIDDNIEGYKFKDNINIIEDDLTYLNPLYRRTCSVGTFKNKKDPETGDEVTETYYAYYNNRGEAVVTKDRSSLPTAQERIYVKKVNQDTGDIEYVIEQGDVRQFTTPIQLYNTVTVNNADSITTDKRKEYTLNLLKIKDYLGYSGTFTSFNFGLNITNLVELYISNNKLRTSNSVNSRVSGKYRIKNITRDYGPDGLYMTVEVSAEVQRY